MSKKFIVKVVAGRSRFDALQMMHNLAVLLYNSHGISIMGMNPTKCEFETPNCIVRYIYKPDCLRGIKADEIFGCDPETRAYRRKPSNTLPYDGGILEYILEVEKAAAEKEPEPEQVCEYDILEFLENVMGLELLDCQKEIVKKYNDEFFKGKYKVVYGRGGKIYVVPVEDNNEVDRGSEEVGRGEP